MNPFSRDRAGKKPYKQKKKQIDLIFIEERKEKDLCIKYGKKGYQAREYKKLDPEQKNNKEIIIIILQI